jgi:hypothetical protein
MTSYRIALFLHLLGLMLAASAGATTKLAVSRRVRARTVGEALDWHRVQMKASKLFPIALAVFTITGLYMVAVGHIHMWSTGFIVAGLVGVALLFASGAFLGMKAKALEGALENIAKNGNNLPAPRLVPPRVVTILPHMNSGIAFGVIFDMATKPTSVAVALGVLVIGVAVHVALGMRQRPATPAKRAVEARTRSGFVEEPRVA